MSIKIDSKNFEEQLVEIVKEIQQELAEEVIMRAKSNIMQMDMNVSGTLRNSFEIKETKELEKEVVNNAPYSSAVNDGSRPHYPPWENLVPWVNEVMRLQGVEAANTARAVAYHISKFGTKPKPFFTNAVKVTVRKHEGVRATD